MVKKAGLVMALVAGGLLAGTASALAQEAPAAVDGVLSGNVVQIPITIGTPIQVCNNNVAAGLVTVVVDPFAHYCMS